ncbi:endonuclease [Roseivirga seohaensis subsp. aquiponti]|uniref:Endonuclease n=1 Tax=Roseivirga seohaensis subsp. aquiponti TaxID=1566026 RepID=A0A0L8APN4_9BACT|nr:endonuclease/exonuclease/phosphatase family protein [Roseivirga seohaensis]KOF04137.1 endonuclease [Roseivirga seohaensis subsp. aquiponti]
MKIVTWNCSGAFRKKFEAISVIKADIYVIQECENPKECTDQKYSSWAKNYLWIGDNKNKGIGIFSSRENMNLTRLDWSNSFEDHSVKHFLPCRVNNEFNILGVWTHRNNSPTFGYIGQFWKYLQVNQEKLNNTIIAGDFNSNSIWDKWDRWWNHSDVVQQLNQTGIVSLYHEQYREDQGMETRPTFFFRRKHDRPYHIDYFFAGSEFLSRLKKLEVGKIHTWIELSDHVPIICEFHQP